MKRLIYLILLLFGLSGCKTEQQEVQNPIVVDTDFVLQENYYGGAMQWEPNDRDSMTEEQWDRLFRRVEFMKLGYIRCCIMPYFYCFGYDGNDPILLWDMDSTKVDARWYANSRRFMNDLYRQLQFCKDNDIIIISWPGILVTARYYSLQLFRQNGGQIVCHNLNMTIFQHQLVVILNFAWCDFIASSNVQL